MLSVIKHLDDLNTEQGVVEYIAGVIDEVKQILPHLNTDLNIYFDTFCLIEEQGCGGFAYSPDTLTIAFSLEFTDKDLQLRHLRETVFHECYHLAQGYTSETFHGSPLEEAIYEGAATVFEREEANATPGYAVYDSEKVGIWLKHIKLLDEGYDRDRWKFYDVEDEQRWKLYKVGVFIVEEYLKRHPSETIVSLNRLRASEILSGSELT